MRNLMLKYVLDIKVLNSNGFYFKMNFVKLNFDNFWLSYIMLLRRLFVFCWRYFSGSLILNLNAQYVNNYDKLLEMLLPLNCMINQSIKINKTKH